MPAPLLMSRRFLPLFLAQGLGAAVDNLFKSALAVLALRGAGEHGPALVALAGGAFILPYALFSATAGQVADRFEKSRLIVAAKAFEAALMLAAAWGFAAGSLPALFAVLFGLGVQAAFFSPLKYAILPAHLAPEELVAGNGLVEAGTFLGILAGSIAGAAMASGPSGPGAVGAAGVALALLGLGASLFVPRAPAAAPGLAVGRNPLAETARLIRAARARPALWPSILGLSCFWATGSSVVAQLPVVAEVDLGADPSVVTAFFAAFAFGTGIGSVACSRLLGGTASARLAPFAALGISGFALAFAAEIHAAPAGIGTAADLLGDAAGARMLAELALLAACGGVFSVPLYALLQARSAPGEISRTIAANNAVNAFAMAAAAGVCAALSALGAGSAAILALAALGNLLAAAWIARPSAREGARRLLRIYFRLCHRARVEGLDHLPGAGRGCVVVANHQSFLDGCLLAAFLPGDPVFAIDTGQARRFRFLRAVADLYAVDPANPMAAKGMIAAVRAGRTLVIFPEGRITVTGALMKIYDGPGAIADRAGAPLVPARIEGALFHKSSRMRGLVRQRWFPRLEVRVLPPVEPRLDPALKGRARRAALGEMVRDLMVEAAFSPASADRALFAAVLDAARDQGARKVAAGGPESAPLSYRRLLLASLVLGRALARRAGTADPRGRADGGLEIGGEVAGVMLPNAPGALVALLGLWAFARTAAPLNPSAGAASMLSCCRAARVRVVVSSREFVTRANLGAAVERMQEAGIRFLWLEEVRASIGPIERLRGVLDLLRARRLPGALASPDSPLVVLFTSGSEGAPKGVVHTHRGVLSNCGQMLAAADFGPGDAVLNAMPMFHSFGLTGGALLPLLCGARVFFYPSPLHHRAVPEAVYQSGATVVFGTDTFLSAWARHAHPCDFRAVRCVFAGAERLREETRRLYLDRFGVRVLEAYGATEMAPAIAMNTPGADRPGGFGRFLPATEIRLEGIPGFADGRLLHVRGPQLMLGYVREGAPGAIEPPAGGWYNTGDLVRVDEGGWGTFVARLRRIAKIAGEMVSLPAAEALACEVWPEAAHAVVAVPDPRKGQRLVLVTTRAGADPGALLARARGRGVAEIAVPRAVLEVAAMPLLGTGKVDLNAVQALAERGRAGVADDGESDPGIVHT